MSLPTKNDDFPEFIQKIITHWDELALRHNLETLEAFETRIFEGLKNASDRGEHALVVSSGGVIATLANIATNAPRAERWRMFVGVAHTSQHRFRFSSHGLEMMQYGAVPHLDMPERRHAITYV